MNKDAIKKQISIDREKCIDFLTSLIKVPSQDLKPTYAQELVRAKLRELGFSIDSFPCYVDEIKDLPDFCTYPGNLKSPDYIENVVGLRTPPVEEAKSFLIHAHIDTACVNDATKDTVPEIKDGRIYGLGAADDKGGIAIMLMAAEAVLNTIGDLKGKLTLMSTIGKRGAVGTLTAFMKGYSADGAVYLHPAETGHGFREIKNYSMGTLDFKIKIKGKPGVYRDEIDKSEINAVNKGAEVIKALSDWDDQRRDRLKFAEGTFSGLPNTKVNIINAFSGDLLREDPLSFEIQCRMYFGLGETVDSVLKELETYLHKYFADDEWLSVNEPQIEKGELRANPVYIEKESELIRSVTENIATVKERDDFIYQYHGASDIRMPIIYGNTPTIGIGPLCGGLKPDEREWMDIDDYIDGIKILAGLIIDWCL